MLRHALWAALACLLSIAFFSCTGVLGDFQLGTTTVDVTPEEAGTSTDSSAIEDAPSLLGGACATPNAKDCQGKDIISCNSGVWQKEASCPYLCVDGGCRGVCTPNENKCDGT